MDSGVEGWVRHFLEEGRASAERSWEDVAEVAAHPSRRAVACTVTVRDRVGVPTRTRVALVALDTGAHRMLDLGPEERSPAWSPDGERLAVVTSDDRGADQVAVLEHEGLTLVATSAVEGAVERVRWAPDGSRLALVVADPGAEVSDVHGSGVIDGPDTESWRPRVLPGSLGWRRLVVWDPVAGTHDRAVAPNLWEADWLGTGSLLALVSDQPGEDDWYTARLVVVDLASGEMTDLLTPEHQLAQPRGSRTGEHWSILAGAASDRDMLVGSLVVGSLDVGGPGTPPTVVDTGSVHVSDHEWLPDGTVLFAGLRGQETVLAVADPAAGTINELWAAPQTTGKFQPALGGLSAVGPVTAVEDHVSPPGVAVIRDGVPDVLLRSRGPAVAHVAAHAGRREPISWAAPDGVEVQGYLTLPDATAPHPLVVDVHGGPIGAVRNTWAGRDPYVSVLVARGYAVLQANPRGSTGRGAEFAEAVIGDMGGADVEDILAGVRRLIDDGTADGGRVGTTGVSYGGYLAAWMPCVTDIFKAGVSRSPCTDWELMHLTSNIREFVRIFVGGHRSDPDSQYRTRSPLQYAHRVRTPLLFTAGGRDLACPPSQAHAMYTALMENGVESELVVYPEEGHDVKGHDALVDQCARLVAWFERFMPA